MRSVEYLKEHKVDVDKSLELFGDMKIYNETMQDFLDGIDEKKENLKKYKDQDNWPNYAIYAHSIKSDARYLGFADVAAKCLEHEMAGKESNQHFIEKDYDNIIKKTDEMIAIVKEYLTGDDDKKEVVKEEAKEEFLSSKPVILVADDSSLVGNFASKMLSDKYDVLIAKDGAEVLNIIKGNQHEILCLLLDLNMPNVDGYKVLDYFKENNLFGKIPVSIITGEDSKEGIKKAFDYDIIDMLNKPFSKDDIINVVEKTIAKRAK